MGVSAAGVGGGRWGGSTHELVRDGHVLWEQFTCI